MKKSTKSPEEKKLIGQIALYVLFFAVLNMINGIINTLYPSKFMDILSIAINIILILPLILITIRTVSARYQKMYDKNTYYEKIIDAVQFPIHVTDNNMKWTYMNKSFEQMLSKNGAIKDRDSSYGMACCTANANICNTENCGIRQLRETGKAETYFDWFDQKCKQDTSAIKDEAGDTIGYVEVVSDLTSILKVNEYTKKGIEELSRVLDSIAEGNLDVKFEVQEADQYTQEMQGLFKKINVSLSRASDSIRVLVSETDKLIQAGINGELEVRGDTSKISGVYAQIVDGVNKTFDSIKTPLDASAEFLRGIAAGTAMEPIENSYKGYFHLFVNDLNSVLSSLLVLLNETMSVVGAGQQGQLNFRGDSSKVQGGYATIINGINETLDAIVKPLEESAVVLGKFAYNDYTIEMTGQYTGAFKTFAESINLVRTRLLSTQDALIKLGSGDLSRLEEFKKIGKRSENDRIMPAVTHAYQTISDLVESANNLATAAYDGQLQMREDVDKFQGGYRQIIEGMNRTMEAVSRPIEESSSVLQELAQGDLTVRMAGDYSGSYNLIKDGLNQVIDSFNELLSDIVIASEQVAVGSSQVSEGSQQLSQGATEQASAIEELTSSITEISAQTRQNAVDATQANTLASQTQAEAAQGTEKMKQMLRSMQDINDSSANISKINKAIDDIAFQTNILALNAAVEAARAGQYGKGFAVVAEEVRNLAAKSAEAAKEATALIESSIGKVDQGTKIANDTANSLNNIADSIQKVTNLVGSIASASNGQATAIAQVDQGLTQVSSVVQTNSATAEESAASSEELNGQADTLKQMVGKFKLRRSGGSPRDSHAKAAALKPVSNQKKPIISLGEEFGKY